MRLSPENIADVLARYISAKYKAVPQVIVEEDGDISLCSPKSLMGLTRMWLDDFRLRNSLRGIVSDWEETPSGRMLVRRKITASIAEWEKVFERSPLMYIMANMELVFSVYGGRVELVHNTLEVRDCCSLPHLLKMPRTRWIHRVSEAGDEVLIFHLEGSLLRRAQNQYT